MSDAETWLDEFRSAGALLSGHFLLSSGMHSDTYLQCAKIMEQPKVAEKMCSALAEKWKEPVSVVAGPAYGGILVAYELARALGARAVFLERGKEGFVLRRGFEIASGENVLVAEDVVTTGGSAAEAIQQIKKIGGRLVGVTSLVSRGAERAFSDPFEALVQVSPPAWQAEACPLCQKGSRPVKPGSRPGANSCEA